VSMYNADDDVTLSITLSSIHHDELVTECMVELWRREQPLVDVGGSVGCLMSSWSEPITSQHMKHTPEMLPTRAPCKTPIKSKAVYFLYFRNKFS
jgi:hypothetical protein